MPNLNYFTLRDNTASATALKVVPVGSLEVETVAAVVQKSSKTHQTPPNGEGPEHRRVTQLLVPKPKGFPGAALHTCAFKPPRQALPCFCLKGNQSGLLFLL